MNQLLGQLINTVAVLALVQLLKTYIPMLKTYYPWLLPIIAAAAGPLVALLQNWITGALGVPIDLTPISGIFSGGAAVMVNQVGKQWSKNDVTQ
jgi:hypothetical protein